MKRSGPPHGGYACEDTAEVVLGAHDGVGTWTINAHVGASPEQQALASRHERQHHRLHESTPWGLAMTFAASVAAGPFGALAWQAMLSGSTEVHKAFATFFAPGQPGDLAFLPPRYVGYSQRARQLGDGIGSGRARLAVIDALLRSALSPVELVEINPADIPFLVLHGAPAVLPDSRLAAIELVLAEARHRATLAALASTQPAQLQDDVAALLRGNDITVASAREFRIWAEEVVHRLNAAGPGMWAITTGGDGVSDAADDYTREIVRLDGRPLPVQLVSPQDPDWTITWLARTAPQVGAHAWLVWLLPSLLAQQFELPPELAARERPLLAFLGVDRTHVPPVARLWPFPALDPASVALAMSEQARLRVLYVTSLASLSSDPVPGPLPSCVLVDQPLGSMLDQASEALEVVRWRAAQLTGSHDLGVLLFDRAGREDTIEVLVSTPSAQDAFVRLLAARGVAQSREVAATHEAHVKALLDHLCGSSWSLHRLGDAATERSMGREPEHA
jgi:hypothetical protein